MEPAALISHTSEIVSNYLSHNMVAAEAIPALINSVFAALNKIANPPAPEPAAAVDAGEKKPAVSVKKSVTSEYLICLEDGKQLKTLKRHLRTKYGMTPAQYRAKWGLPREYPMVAPEYAKKRSDLARKSGLGNGRREAA